MTTESDGQNVASEEMGENLEKLNANVAKMEELSQRLVSALAQRESHDQGLQGPGSDVYMKAMAAYITELMSNPAKLVEHQVGYWGKTLKHVVEAQHMLAKGQLAAPHDEHSGDRRFKNPLWDTHPYFNFVKQQYLISAESIEKAIGDIDGLAEMDKRRVSFFSKQIVDLFSPANFLTTNPDALQRAVETNGESLVQGLENLVRDIEANHGEHLVTLSDPNAFVVGQDLATSEGSVVYRNRMFELIQYAPKTETVHKTPLILFPPWINKFYILDLKPKNSLIKWIVEQGYTLFVVSWVNPDASYADVSLDTYIEEGYLTAIDEVKKITGEAQVNAVGYCIAGTTLSATLALMNKRGDKSVKSATFFTTLTDFEDAGEMSVFLDNDFVDGIEREVDKKGYLHSFFMARTFSFLRANDLVYGPAIRSYMMGDKPPAFDLLHWNGDSTNLPGKMVVQYLRDLCQDNKLANGTFEICGETVSLKDVKTPVYAIACETDHIAAWKGSFEGFKKFGSRDKTFIVSESGHIAGIVNPPSKKKYGHYTNDAKMEDADGWMETATFNDGSWWPRWSGWLARRSGKQVEARQPGDSTHPVLAAAPGTYVVSRPDD
ncbi:PHA/PHB synthase family protein [Tropicimonas sp. S265A]|uniref:PHA/PHB synthase family protein n=1 Tax=Tropicimonas sp. S265A TaxID=3415134 RepID=UPI003C7D093F